MSQKTGLRLFARRAKRSRWSIEVSEGFRGAPDWRDGLGESVLLHVSSSQRGKMECHEKPQRRFAGHQANETKMFSASLLRSESS